MHDRIVAIANKRLVTSEDFRPFARHLPVNSQANPDVFPTEWAVFPAAYIPGDDHSGDVVARFFVRRVLNHNFVEIGVFYGAGFAASWVAVHISADELAIRIEQA